MFGNGSHAFFSFSAASKIIALAPCALSHYFQDLYSSQPSPLMNTTILYFSRMRRNVNRKVYNDRKNVSATTALCCRCPDTCSCNPRQRDDETKYDRQGCTYLFRKHFGVAIGNKCIQYKMHSCRRPVCIVIYQYTSLNFTMLLCSSTGCVLITYIDSWR